MRDGHQRGRSEPEDGLGSVLELGNPRGRRGCWPCAEGGTPQGVTEGHVAWSWLGSKQLASGHQTLQHLTCFIPELPYPDGLQLPAQPSCGVCLVCHNSDWVLKDVHKGG